MLKTKSFKMTLSVCQKQAAIARTWAGGDVILWWHFSALPVNGDNITEPNQTKSSYIDHAFLSGLPRACPLCSHCPHDCDNQLCHSKDRTANIAKYLWALKFTPQKKTTASLWWFLSFPCMWGKELFANKASFHELSLKAREPLWPEECWQNFESQI